MKICYNLVQYVKIFWIRWLIEIHLLGNETKKKTLVLFWLFCFAYRKKKGTVQLINVECVRIMSIWFSYFLSLLRTCTVSYRLKKKIQWNFVKKIFQARWIVCLNQLLIKMMVSRVRWNDRWFVCANDVLTKPLKSFAAIVKNVQNFQSHKSLFYWGTYIILFLNIFFLFFCLYRTWIIQNE